MGGDPSGTGKALRHRPKNRRGNRVRQADGLDRSDPGSMAALLPLFLENLAVKNYAPITIENARKNLVLFLRWCAERDLTQPVAVTRPILESYQRTVFRYRQERNGRPLSQTAQRARLGALKLFFRWLCRSHLILHNPASELEMPRVEHRLPQVPLSAEEVERILALPDIATPLGLRDRAILETLYSTALRRQELARLLVPDLYLDRHVLFVRQGKGHKDRYVPVGARALSWMERYLLEARPVLLVDAKEQALFLSGYGDGALHPGYLTHLVTSYIRKADLGRSGSCHLFRHTCATLMLENGADIRFIQQLLGHSSLKATAIYTAVSIAQLQKVHALTHPSGQTSGAK